MTFEMLGRFVLASTGETKREAIAPSLHGQRRGDMVAACCAPYAARCLSHLSSVRGQVALRVASAASPPYRAAAGGVVLLRGWFVPASVPMTGSVERTLCVCRGLAGEDAAADEGGSWNQRWPRTLVHWWQTVRRLIPRRWRGCVCDIVRTCVCVQPRLSGQCRRQQGKERLLQFMRK